MLDKKEFKAIKLDLKKQESRREQLIQNSREVIRLSKIIIYSLHRDDVKKASSVIKTIKNKIKNIPKDASLDTNINRTALQEYVEALCYYSFLKSSKIPSRKSLNVDSESYLIGLCDLSGELMRKAVQLSIKKKKNEVLKIKNFIDELYGQFLQFDLRNSELRKKSDSIKWNLRKVEEVAFGLK